MVFMSQEADQLPSNNQAKKPLDSDYYWFSPQKKSEKNQLVRLISIPLNLITWTISFFFARALTNVILNPHFTKLQRMIHRVNLTNNHEIILVNLVKPPRFKFFRDLFHPIKFSAPGTITYSKDKAYIDKVLAEIKKLAEGTSKAKHCENKKFNFEQLHLKGIEFLH